MSELHRSDVEARIPALPPTSTGGRLRKVSTSSRKVVSASASRDGSSPGASVAGAWSSTVNSSVAMIGNVARPWT